MYLNWFIESLIPMGPPASIHWGDLRVLGPPNPVQSFRRGLWGREATEVSMDPGGVAALPKLKSYSCFSFWGAQFWQRGSPLSLALSFFNVFFENVFLHNFKLRDGVAGFAASTATSIWVPACGLSLADLFFNVFLKTCFCKISNSVMVWQDLPPPQRHQFGSPHEACL